MFIDVRTLVVVLLLSNTLVGLILAWARWTLPHGRGTSEWMVAAWAMVGAWLALAGRFVEDGPLLVSLQNALLILGAASVSAAHRRFVDTRVHSRRLYGAALGGAALFTVVTFAGATFTVRAVLSSVLTGGLGSLSAVALLRGLPAKGLPCRRLGGVVSALVSVLILLRGAYTLVRPDDAFDFVRNPSSVQALALLPMTAMLLAMAFIFVLMQVEESEKRAHELASTDQLTGCFSRRVLEDFVRSELSLVGRRRGSLALVIADADRFKSVNDTHGHAVGDMVLRHVAAVLKSCVRGSDLLARYGGEEFCVVLRDTDAAGAALFAERARARLAEAPAAADDLSIPVTASFGVASVAEGGGWEELFRRADAALYRAKEKGRNRVEVAG